MLFWFGFGFFVCLGFFFGGGVVLVFVSITLG